MLHILKSSSTTDHFFIIKNLVKIQILIILHVEEMYR